LGDLALARQHVARDDEAVSELATDAPLRPGETVDLVTNGGELALGARDVLGLERHEELGAAEADHAEHALTRPDRPGHVLGTGDEVVVAVLLAAV
ncbi:MAG: hypothetical protein WBO92_04940, partial [Candidatus Moraniibacteriota bacterium]